jgi:hypothetical protein
LAGIIAFARKSHEIAGKDVMLAHTLLALNEVNVEACYSALHAERSEARLFTKMVEYIDLHGQVDIATLIAYMKSATNIRELDLMESVSRMFNIKRLIQGDDGIVRLNNEGSRLRLDALTVDLRNGALKE